MRARTITTKGGAIPRHKTDALFSYYLAKANRRQLADRVMAKLNGDLCSPDE